MLLQQIHAAAFHVHVPSNTASRILNHKPMVCLWSQLLWCNSHAAACVREDVFRRRSIKVTFSFSGRKKIQTGKRKRKEAEWFSLNLRSDNEVFWAYFLLWTFFSQDLQVYTSVVRWGVQLKDVPLRAAVQMCSFIQVLVLLRRLCFRSTFLSATALFYCYVILQHASHNVMWSILHSPSGMKPHTWTPQMWMQTSTDATVLSWNCFTNLSIF